METKRRTYDMFYVYWIHRACHTDPYTQGYIGITNNVQRRWYQHDSGHGINQHLINAYEKYDDIIREVIYEHDNEGVIKLAEFHYRPDMNIGWNINEGGMDTGFRNGADHHASVRCVVKSIRHLIPGGYTGYWKRTVTPYRSEDDPVIGVYDCYRDACIENGMTYSGVVHEMIQGNTVHIKGLYIEGVR